MAGGRATVQSPAVLRGQLAEATGGALVGVGESTIAELLDVAAEIVGAKGDAATENKTAIETAIDSGNYKRLTLKKKSVYLYNALKIDGEIYSEIFNTGEADPAGRTSKFDEITREYIDASGNVWRFALRGSRLPLQALPASFDASQFARAINQGAATVTFIGTSITEGEDAQAEAASIWANRLKMELQRTWPGVAWTFKNLGLNSRRLSDFVDTGYLALSSEPANKRDGFWRPTPGVDTPASVDTWPDGVTVGESWQWHVEQTEPDLYIIHMGQNDLTDPDQYAADLTTAITHIQGLAKVPSIALVTEMPPHQVNDAGVVSVRAFARITRNLARVYGVGVIDVNRHWEYARRGVDECQHAIQRVSSIADWEETGATPTAHTADSLAQTAALSSSAIKRGNYSGIAASFTFNPVDEFGACFVSAHIEGASGYADESITVRRVSTRFDIFDKAGNVIAQFTGLTAVAAAVTESIDIRIIENRVEAWKDYQPAGFYNMQNVGHYGGVAVTANKSTLSNIVADVAYPKTLGKPIFNDDFLVGRDASSAWNAGTVEDGGNTLNHPSRWGLLYPFQSAIAEFMDQLIKRVDSGAILEKVGDTDISVTSTTLADTGESIDLVLQKAARVTVTVDFPFVSSNINVGFGNLYLYNGATALKRRSLRPNPSGATNGDAERVCFTWTGFLEAGAHTLKTRWNSGGALETISSNAGTTSAHERLLHVQVH